MKISFLLPSVLALTLALMPAVAAPTGWETFGNGPAHTGYYPEAVGLGTFARSWSQAMNPGINQAVVAGSAVYVTGTNGSRFNTPFFAEALDIRTGQPLWKYEMASGNSINPPTYAAGKLYFQRGNASNDTQLWSLNAATGKVAWIAPHGAQWESYYAPTVVGDKVWVDGGGYGGLYGFKVADGAQLFFNNALEQYDQWTPTYYNGALYTWVAGNLRAHDPLTGVVKWSVSLGWDWHGWSMNGVAAMAGNRAFVVGAPGLHAVDLVTRSKAWSASGNFTGTPAVAGNTVFALSGFEVKAYAVDTGNYLGTYVAPGGNGLWLQPLITDDRVFASNSSNTYIFDRATFALLQTIPGGGWLSYADGTLYITQGARAPSRRGASGSRGSSASACRFSTVCRVMRRAMSLRKMGMWCAAPRWGSNAGPCPLASRAWPCRRAANRGWSGPMARSLT